MEGKSAIEFRENIFLPLLLTIFLRLASLCGADDDDDYAFKGFAFH